MSIFKRTQRKYVKKAYRVRNWREYEAGLRNRGSLTVWISLTVRRTRRRLRPLSNSTASWKRGISLRPLASKRGWRRP